MDVEAGASTRVLTLFRLLILGLCCSGFPLSSEDTLVLRLSRVEFIFSSLRSAEEDYVTYVFGNKPPEKYRANTWDLVRGVRLSNSSTDVLQSSCTISQSMEVLPAIVRTLTQTQHSILGNISQFSHVFRQVLEPAQAQCDNRTFSLPRTRYEKKELGLKIIFSARKWIQYSTNTAQFN
uniref:Uncharacterized protein n=1 Tax=Knipowitschia caucasica TaxID=637954 RepID=A0AAV2MT56_KNICA